MSKSDKSMNFLNEIYIRGPHELEDIITFGRPPAQRARDLARGIGRIGGSLRQPNYAQAYIHSASQLVKIGETTDTLDEIALPAFYLQRHAAELLLKQVLSMLIDISNYRARYEKCPPAHSMRQQDRLEGSHTLTKLLNDVETLATALKHAPPPAVLGELIGMLSAVEVTETWSRYSSSKGGAVQHVEKEVEVPLREIQEKLMSTSRAIAYPGGQPDSYEEMLYEIWQMYALHFGDLE